MAAEPYFRMQVPSADQVIDFNSSSQFVEFLDKEIDAWEWLWKEPSPFSPTLQQNSHQLRTILIQLRNAAIEQGEEIANPAHMNNLVAHAFGGESYSTYFSQSDLGGKILAMRGSQGADRARMILELNKNRLNWAALSGPWFQKLVGAITGDENNFGEIGESLAEERRLYRSEITKLRNRVAELERVHEATTAHESALTRRYARKLSGIGQRVWSMREKEIFEKVLARLNSMAETEDRFANQMALQAPVQYWKAKSREHSGLEKTFRTASIAYFALALIVILAGAWGAITFIESYDDAHRASAYVITAGALLGGTTLVFWLGRIIIKLYLSEHHLRSDSDEKAVMTQAFLSMSSNGNFTETERSIILASIFRSSPDGIVKEEGPGDFGANALLAKLLMK